MKKTIRLTESELHRLISETVNSVINEADYNLYNRQQRRYSMMGDESSNNRENAVEKLMQLAHDDDAAVAHLEADYTLCGLLNSLGYKDVVDAYSKVKKNYR